MWRLSWLSSEYSYQTKWITEKGQASSSQNATKNVQKVAWIAKRAKMKWQKCFANSNNMLYVSQERAPKIMQIHINIGYCKRFSHHTEMDKSLSDDSKNRRSFLCVCVIFAFLFYFITFFLNVSFYFCDYAHFLFFIFVFIFLTLSFYNYNTLKLKVFLICVI